MLEWEVFYTGVRLFRFPPPRSGGKALSGGRSPRARLVWRGAELSVLAMAGLRPTSRAPSWGLPGASCGSLGHLVHVVHDRAGA